MDFEAIALETGIDFPQIHLKEYNRIKQEYHIKEESMEIWNVALNNIIKSQFKLETQ